MGLMQQPAFLLLVLVLVGAALAVGVASLHRRYERTQRRKRGIPW